MTKNQKNRKKITIRKNKKKNERKRITIGEKESRLEERGNKMRSKRKMENEKEE